MRACSVNLLHHHSGVRPTEYNVVHVSQGPGHQPEVSTVSSTLGTTGVAMDNSCRLPGLRTASPMADGACSVLYDRVL